jgi:hypothetical protein
MEEKIPARHTQLYLKTIENLSINENHQLLRFYSDIRTSNNKTRLAYTLFDSRALHGFIDERYALTLGLAMKSCSKMRITTANNMSATIDRRQLYLEANLTGIRGNQVLIDGWYTIFDLQGSYDVIVGKN